MVAKFTIGSTVQFGKENWKVLYYTKESGKWEVVFILLNSKKRKNVLLDQLEKFA